MSSPVMSAPVWSTTVRYAEADQQGIVFNSHYLVYADEAMGAFCIQRGLLDLAARMHVVASNLSWSSSARWSDVVDVSAECIRIGTSSLVMRFAICVGERMCCTVETTYVYAIDGHGAPIPDDARAALSPAT